MVPGPNILQLLGHNVQMFILSSSVCPRKASEHSLMFAVKARSIPQSGAPQRCFIKVEFGISQTFERLARDKHSSLLPKFVNCGRKKIYIKGPRPQYYLAAY